jgi:hypothetical protein
MQLFVVGQVGLDRAAYLLSLICLTVRPRAGIGHRLILIAGCRNHTRGVFLPAVEFARTLVRTELRTFTGQEIHGGGGADAIEVALGHDLIYGDRNEDRP